MFASYVYEKSSAKYSNRIILIDEDGLEARANYSAYFEARGFQIIRYIDDLHLRVEHDEALNTTNGKYALLVHPRSYVPYDVIRRFRCYIVSFSNLFPKLNTSAIKDAKQVNLDLLCMAYNENFNDLHLYQMTKEFIEQNVYDRSNIRKYLKAAILELNAAVSSATTYNDWFRIANIKAAIDVMATEYDLDTSTELVHQRFLDYILENFGKLSSVMDLGGPVLVSRAMEYMHDHSEKFVVIVMDGMSEFDWKVISEYFSSFQYDKSNAFAMIPTTTSISRQCLLSNKYPSQLMEPWKQSKEKAEFIACAKDMGFTDEQIAYERGYDADFGSLVRCGAIIINDIDNLVHGQTQGRIGMLNDITVLAKQAKLYETTRRLLKKGFDVYITADHGNTPCIGVGKLMKTGVEVETKSRRMVVLRDFADKQVLLEQYVLINYPKYYLSKDYDYLICGIGQSFDAKGEEVMSHGGITVDEVIVPFIKIKADENNG